MNEIKHNSETVESQVLSDKKQNNKERPWREKKMRGILTADSFERLGETKRAGRIRDCGTFLEFKKNEETGQKFLSAANFCRERLCPMCQWRRSLRVFYECSIVLDIAEAKHQELMPLFLTLTLKNCKAEAGELSKTLDVIFKGWHRFINHSKMKKVLAGWFRALELTYNKKTNEFHPHIHALILVDKDYFKKGYLETSEWVRLWRMSLGIDYDPICDIRRIRNNKNRRKGIAEVAKYTVKDTEIISHEEARTDALVSALSVSLKGRRLYAFGGILKQIQANLTDTDTEDGDLVHVGDGTIRNDVATIVERYRWSFGLSQYVKVQEKKVPE
jgi:plasmid rolling circle replication initiator protein Rep